ncbi:MAG: ferrochelatase [Nitrospiraceae bacterium]|nr:MAG: ferrochelatase [Nitrospiraceae bacterium]
MTADDKHITGVLLLNLGGPDSLDAVRPFLFNLFSDREIIRLGPSFLQKPIAWLISTLRSKKTMFMYSRIGGKSPIFDITKAQAEALEKALNQNAEKSATAHPSLPFKVYIGMRYWRPFIIDTLNDILHDKVQHLIVLTLYPHYSKATSGSSIDEFKRAVARLRNHDSRLNIQYIAQWYDFTPYIEALTELVADGISELKGSDFQVLYSAHSLPQSFIDEGDPYLEHIKSTIKAVNSLLATRYSLPVTWQLSFQSKTGPVKWLEPSTEKTIEELAHSGCRHLFIVPISFVSDHIETLYEIDIQYKELAEKHGMKLKRCKALNTSDTFILAMKQLVMAKIT